MDHRSILPILWVLNFCPYSISHSEPVPGWSPQATRDCEWLVRWTRMYLTVRTIWYQLCWILDVMKVSLQWFSLKMDAFLSPSGTCMWGIWYAYGGMAVTWPPLGPSPSLVALHRRGSRKGLVCLIPRPHPLRRERSGARCQNSWTVPQNTKRPIKSQNHYVNDISDQSNSRMIDLLHFVPYCKYTYRSSYWLAVWSRKFDLMHQTFPSVEVGVWRRDYGLMSCLYATCSVAARSAAPIR